MKKFPYYAQLDTMDCGPTCLRMIAKHYGRNLSIQSLREKTQINKDGVSFMGIAEAAESIGFKTLGIKADFQTLSTQAPLPCLVHWGQNHFVIVYSIKQKKWWSFSRRGEINHSNERGKTRRENKHQNIVHVADPAKGLLRYSQEEFETHWLSMHPDGQKKGVALLFEAGLDFGGQEDETPSTAYDLSRVTRYLWNHKSLLVQLLIGLIVGSGLQLIFPFLTQSVVDIGITTQNYSFLTLILGGQLMLMATRLLVEFVRSWILLYLSARINLSIISDFMIKLMRLPISFFDTKQFGDLLQRINDHHRIEIFLTGQTITVLFSLINMIVFGAVLALYNKLIFIIYFVGSTLYVGWVLLFLKKRRQLDFRRFDASSENQGSLIQLIYGMQEIRLAGAERPMRWAWERLQATLFKLQMKSLALGQYQQAGGFALNEGKNIIITFLAAQAVINGQLTLGGMLALQYVVGQLNSPIEQLVTFVQGLQDAKISLERLNEIHTLEDEEAVPPDYELSLKSPVITENNGLIAGPLELTNISFSYPGNQFESVLKNISLVIPAGSTTAIVGMSGSGKTTLIKLLLRFYEPSGGQILLDGRSLLRTSPKFWRKQCGVVMQDGFIFSDTIARNIAVGEDQIEFSRLKHAVEVANLQTFIETLPLGFNTKIGAEGNGLSQGQRQRILIARAVYKDPSYIFFDEATNALDANNEAVIVDQLNKFFIGRTVIIVAHRLSTVRNADQIIVLDKGEVTEVGTHVTLVEKKGAYWQLVRNQLEMGN